MKSSKGLNSPTKAIIKPKDNTVDKLKAHIMDPKEVELTDAQQFKLERLMLADRFTYQYKTRKQVVAFLMAYMKEDDRATSYSERTAERDYYDAQLVFGHARKFDKVYKRNFYINWIEERMAKMDDREFNRAMANLIKLGGFEKEDVEPPQKDLRLHDIVLTYDPSLLGLEKVENLEEKKKMLLRKKRLRKQMNFAAEFEKAELEKEDE